MDAFLPIIALIVIASFSLFAVRIGGTALMMTGLSWDVANFQAYSAFFGVGFTTTEAEHVVNHPVRRRIIKHLILAGNVGLTSGLATLVIALLRAEGEHRNLIVYLAILGGGLLAVGVLFNTGIIRRIMDAWIRAALSRAGIVRATDYDLLLRVSSGYWISEFEIEPGHWLEECTLRNSGLNEAGVLVLGVIREDGYIGAPEADLRFRAGDLLTTYGRESAVREVLHRGEDEAVQ